MHGSSPPDCREPEFSSGGGFASNSFHSPTLAISMLSLGGSLKYSAWASRKVAHIVVMEALILGPNPRAWYCFGPSFPVPTRLSIPFQNLQVMSRKWFASIRCTSVSVRMYILTRDRPQSTYIASQSMKQNEVMRFRCKQVLGENMKD